MNDPNIIVQQLNLLLTGYGYNLYNDKNRMRADDLLVRQRAAGAMSESSNRLEQVASDYGVRCIPPATRENPYPPAEAMARLRDLQALRDRASMLATRIRGMSAPAYDRVWARFRNDRDTLHALLNADYQLISCTEAVADMLQGIMAEDWTTEHSACVRSLMQVVESESQMRDQILQGPL